MTQETRRDLRFPVLTASVFALAAGVAAFVLVRYPLMPTSAQGGSIWVLVALVVSVLLSEALAVLVPGAGVVSLSVPLFVAISVYSGPTAAILAGAVSTVPLLFSHPRLSFGKLVFNVGEVVLTAGIPAIAYMAMGAPLFAISNATFSSELIPALAVAATLGTVINVGLVGVAVSACYGESLSHVLKTTFGSMLSSQLVLGFLGIAIAQIVHTVQFFGFALFVVPLLVARQTYQRSVKLRAAYADTISSLVAALEAKDVYTKGHSVRVAEYTVMIAEEMGFPPDKVRRMEQAALLHDLGKVGVSRRVLAKEGRLTGEEYAEIKRHPDIGAHIVADVPYLADLVPMIEHHHERFDGGGYGSGMAGTDIPVEARVLSVADSYDAMTSARPYRGAMSHEHAMRELRENSGTQFDPDAVASFERASEKAAQSVMPAAVGEAIPDEG
jgi:putative nucleotidyltransferase with HDIG domain